MSEALYERLQRLKRHGQSRTQSDDGGHERSSEPDETQANPAVSECRRSLERIGFTERADGTLVRSVERDVGLVADRISRMRTEGSVLLPDRAAEPVFFDVESTGLGAGAGNVAFLVGAAMLVDTTRVRIEQVLLPDYPNEPQFLKRTARLLRDDCLLVSYNGKGFDTNLLRSRFLMNGIRWHEPEQLDLLYPVRRLWGRVFPDCRLSTVEHNLLGVERGSDVAGAEVPGRYFAFLETGAGEVLREVVAHHEQDMLSLVVLLDTIETTLSKAKTLSDRPLAALGDRGRASAEFTRARVGRRGEGSSASSSRAVARPDTPCGSCAADPVGVARELLRTSGIDSAVEWLRYVCDRKRPTGSVRRAMVLLAGLLKRNAQFEEASRLWSKLFHEGQSVLAGIELAKHLEHRCKNIPAALAVCEKLLYHHGTARENIEHRYERLRRKASR